MGRRLRAAAAQAEALEARTLLAATFASLPYTEPFPAAGQLGQPSQDASSVVYSESFSDQSGTSGGVLGAADHYWNEQATVSRPVPSAMQSGLSQMSVEFWLNVPVGSNVGYGTAITMPGFEAVGNWNWAKTPAGVILMRFSTTKLGEPLASVSDPLGVIADGQWHQYVATYDGGTTRFYNDGELAGQQWITNTADKAGPQVFSSVLSTPTAITYSWMGSTGIDEVRVSNVALTPGQVRRNFENYRHYNSTWYASPSGLSTNSGTRGSPLDLATALTHVGADNKIVLLPGTYNGAAFQITRSGGSPLHDALITGDSGSGQAIISVSGSTQGAVVSSGAKYVTLRNLTFSSDQKAALTFSAAGYGNVVDGCRLSSNVDALSVVNSSGYQDPIAGDGGHYVIVSGVMLENSVLAAGTSYAGVRYNNSKVIVARNDTFVGGQYGAVFTGGSTDVTLLDNVFTGQTGSGVYFNSDSLMDVDGSSSLVSYFGDGNVYNPSGSGYVATVVDGTTNNYSTVSDYAYYWYTKQYGTDVIKSWGDSGIGIGYRSEQRSIRGTLSFVSLAGGDYRLAGMAPNLVDTGAEYVFGRTIMGVSASVWDGQGNARPQGNAVDAGAYETAGAVSHTFTLAAAATTSAGVYDSSGKLIRTLWSGVKKPAGSVTAYWNGLDDNNNPMTNGTYTIKLLSNNVQYVWDGAMNNSSPLDGGNIQANFQPIQSMVIVGANAYYNPGYNEGRNQLYKFALSNINQVTGYGVGPVQINDDLICNIASDGTNLYTLWQTFSTNLSFIKSYDLNFNATGASANVGTAASGAAGIAVQPAQQNLLFVSHTTDNKIYIYNKSTFTPYTTPYLDGTALGWNTPKSIATTSDGDLWVTCKKTSTGQWQILRYTNFGGTPVRAATVTGGLVNPIGLAVSLDGNKTLMVVDGETSTTVCQQIKAYTPAGAALWTLGQLGGYASNGPTITNDKFILEGMICPQADGSFWITDLATGNRTMHFSAARTFINDIEYTRSYTASADQNNPNRVFQNFVEYAIDYSKPFTQNQGWTPVRNWSYLGTTNLCPIFAAGGVDGLAGVATLSNGRTYARVDDLTVTGSDLKRTVELTANGLRDTGLGWDRSWMDKDGSLLWANTVDTQFQFTRQRLTGFDASGNPQYAAATVVGTAPFTRTWDADSTAPSFAPYWCPLFLQLDNGLLVTYNSQVHGAGMHLGALDPTTNQYQWQTMPGSGPANGQGNYDTNNWYGGNRVMVSGHNIITGYNGEGWHGSGQANQFMQYNDDGLFIGQFGTPTGAGAVFAAYGAAGNSFSPFLTSVNGTLYLYTNDESDRSLQRWHAVGLDTIAETSASVGLWPPVAITVPDGDFTDAAGFYVNSNSFNHGPFVGPMNATVSGWTVTANPSTDYGGIYGSWNPYGGVDNTLTNYPANGNFSTNYSGAMPGGATNMFFYYPGEQLTGNSGSRVAQTGAGLVLTTTGISAAAVLGTTYTASIYYASLAGSGSNNGPNVTLNILASGVVVASGSVAGLAPGSPWTQVTATWTASSHIGEAIQLQVVAGNFIEGTSPWLIPNFGLTHATLTAAAPNGAAADPSGLTAAAVSSSQVNLSWTDNSSNETGFKVERATDSGFTQNLTLVTTTAANVTSYSNTGLAANTTYYYRVRATNAGVDSGNSNTAGPVMPLLQINGDQGSVGQSDQIRVARNLADPSLLDVFRNSITPTYSVSFAALNAIVINGLGGDDTLTLDLANGAVIPAGGISYDGGTQTSGDSLIIAGSSGNDAVTFGANQVTIGSGIVTLTGVENLSFKGGAGNDSLALGAGSYTFASDLGVDTTHLSLSLADGAQVAFSGAQHLSSLTVSGSAKVTLADGGRSTLVVQSLSLGGSSSLDVADNAVIVDYTGSSPFATVYSLVASSAGNHWAGNGIVSHTAAGGGSQYALGIADNSAANLASFGGQSVDGTSVLIRFTYAGDANLDGQVDLTDLSILAGSWQMTGRRWSQGDMDYSGLVDLTDLVLLASNWQKVLPKPLGAEVVDLAGDAAVAPPPVDAAAAASEAVAVDPTPAEAAPTQTTSSPAATMTSSTAAQVSEAVVAPLAESTPAAAPVAKSAPVVQPKAAPVVLVKARKKPAGVSVASERAAGIAPMTGTRRTASVFSNRPLSAASAMLPWPMRGQGVQTLLGIGSDEKRDILLGAEMGRHAGFLRRGWGVARGLMG